MTSGPVLFGKSALGRPERSSKRGGEEAVTDAGALPLVADLLEGVGQQVAGVGVVRLGVDELVEDLDGQQVLAVVDELATAAQDRLGAAHHLDVQGRRVAR